MNDNASFYAITSQIRAFIARSCQPDIPADVNDSKFNLLAASLFQHQAASVPIYAKFCAKRKIASVADWREIPALPISAFKDYEVTSLPPEQRTHVFHSSGTTGQRPSRHFHNADSLALYEQSLLPWFRRHVLGGSLPAPSISFLCLTPSHALAPHSSLAHMLEIVGRDAGNFRFSGQVDSHGAWSLDMDATITALQSAQAALQPIALLGAAFSFVHLLDHCAANKTRFRLTAGSRVMETGGYKGRSRFIPKSELRQMLTRCLGIPDSHILTEYGMCELSSQAYDRVLPATESLFHFPPWTRTQIISPETGREVADGETGMLRILDLANIRSVMAIQTEDLAIRRGDGFELIGRDAAAEPRGCSLMLQ